MPSLQLTDRFHKNGSSEGSLSVAVINSPKRLGSIATFKTVPAMIDFLTRIFETQGIIGGFRFALIEQRTSKHVRFKVISLDKTNRTIMLLVRPSSNETCWRIQLFVPGCCCLEDVDQKLRQIDKFGRLAQPKEGDEDDVEDERVVEAAKPVLKKHIASVRVSGCDAAPKRRGKALLNDDDALGSILIDLCKAEDRLKELSKLSGSRDFLSKGDVAAVVVATCGLTGSKMSICQQSATLVRRGFLTRVRPATVTLGYRTSDSARNFVRNLIATVQRPASEVVEQPVELSKPVREHRTRGTVFSFHSDSNGLRIRVRLPFELKLSAAESAQLEDELQVGMEVALQKYWR